LEEQQAKALAEVLGDVAIFNGMSAEQIATVVRSAERLEVPAGEAVFREDEIVDGFYLLERGTISVRKKLNDREAEVGVVEPQTAIGESGMIGGNRRMASCIAATDCVVYRITRGAFDRLCANGSAATVRLVLNIAAILRQRLDRLNEAFVAMSERAQGAGVLSDKVVELDVFRQKLYTEWAF
jgi:CRP-like cAMP-binding protein